VSLAPQFPPLGPTSPLQVPLLRHPVGRHRRSLRALSLLWFPYPPDSSSKIPTPGGYHGCTTCRHRRPATPYMAGLTGCLRPARGGSQSCGDMWHPWSCPTLGGGCWSLDDTWHPRSYPALGGGSRSCPTPGGGYCSPGDMWHPQRCTEPGGGSQSRGDTWHPRNYPRPIGGSWSRRETWRPRSCPAPGGGG
jgi:hypothetical protein